jgi:hypothetical protein
LQNEPIEYESQLELRFVHEALLCPQVTTIKHQPFELSLKHPRHKFYTPDYLLRLADGTSVVIEVKPQIFVAKYVDRFNVIAQTLAEKQLPFFVVTDSVIEWKKRHESAALMLRYLNWGEHSAVSQRVQERLRTRGSCTVAQLQEELTISVETIRHLIAKRQLIPSCLSLSRDTTIRLKNSNDKNGIEQFSKWFNTELWGPIVPCSSTD